MYRGVFGSHVANVLRRLRIAAIHGTEPRFLLASATIANPIELAERLTGLTNFNLIDQDGAPRATRRVAMWNPPLLDEELGVRGSALYEAAEVFAELVTAGAKTICFMKSRKGVELILRHVARPPRLPRSRSGSPPTGAATRRSSARTSSAGSAAGELLGVVATDALELGIDIGELDAAICVTFPGTVANLKQMWGRAGRRGRGLAVYVAGEDALDQFFCRHPGELKPGGRGGHPRPDSPEIYAEHLLCAAHEAPLTDDDATSSAQTGEPTRRSHHAGLLRERATGFVPSAPTTTRRPEPH